MNTIVLPCTCSGLYTIVVKSAGVRFQEKPKLTAIPFHVRSVGVEFQEKRYGKGMRLHNVRQGKTGGATCTVCGTRKSA